MEALLIDIAEGLSGRSSRLRKDGVKVLLQHVDSDNFGAFLDAQQTAPGESIVYSGPDGATGWRSWPGIGRLLLAALEAELGAGKKADAALPKCFRHFAAAATRAERGSKLARVARSLFRHVASRLQTFPEASNLQDSYLRGLHSLLACAPCAALCVASDASALGAELVAVAAREAEGVPLLKALQRLEAHLRNVAASASASQLGGLADVFEGLFARIAGRHTEPALATAAVSTLCHFLMRHGPDIPLRMPQVHAAAASFLRLLWRNALGPAADAHSSVGSRVACMHATLLFLKLDAIRQRKHLCQELQELACGEVAAATKALECPGHCLLQRTSAPPPLSIMEALQVRLLSLLFLRQEQGPPLCTPSSPDCSTPPMATTSTAQVAGISRTRQDAGVDAEGAARGQPRRRLDLDESLYDHLVATGANSHTRAALWACAVAYSAWQLPAQLGALRDTTLVRLVHALRKPVHEWVATRGTGAEMPDPETTAPLHRTGWCILALEGIARMAHGVPRHDRLPYAQDPRVHGALAAHVLAAAVDWNAVAALAEAAAEAAAQLLVRQDAALRAAAAAVAARAMLLRRTLLARCLDSESLEPTPFWQVVARMTAGNTTEEGGGCDPAIGPDAAGSGSSGRLTQAGERSAAAVSSVAQMHQHERVRLNTQYHMAQQRRQRRALAYEGWQVAVAAAQAVEAERLWTLQHLRLRPAESVDAFWRAAAADATTPILPLTSCILRALALPRPAALACDAPVATAPSCAAPALRGAAGPGPTHPDVTCGVLDSGRLPAVAAASAGAWAEGPLYGAAAWAAPGETVLLSDTLVPSSTTPAERARITMWHVQLQQARRVPSALQGSFWLSSNGAVLRSLAEHLTAAVAAARRALDADGTHQALVHCLRLTSMALTIAVAVQQKCAFHGVDQAQDGGAAASFQFDSSLAAELASAVGAVAVALVAAVDALLERPERSLSVAEGRNAGATQGLASVPATMRPHSTQHSSRAAGVDGAGEAAPVFSCHPDGHDELSGAVAEGPYLSGALLQHTQALTCLACHAGGIPGACIPWDAFATAIGRCQLHLEALYGRMAESARQGNCAAPTADDMWASPARGPARSQVRRSRSSSGSGRVDIDTAVAHVAHTRLIALVHALGLAAPRHAVAALERVADALADCASGGQLRVGPAAVPPAEWVADLAVASAAIAQRGGGRAAWDLVIDICRLEGIGLEASVVSMPDACHTLLRLATAAAAAAHRERTLPTATRASQGDPAARPLSEELDTFVQETVQLMYNRSSLLGQRDDVPDTNIARNIASGSSWQLRAHCAALLASAASWGGLRGSERAHVRQQAYCALVDPSSRVRLVAAAAVPFLDEGETTHETVCAIAPLVPLPGLAAALATRSSPVAGPRQVSQMREDACVFRREETVGMPAWDSMLGAAAYSALVVSAAEAGQQANAVAVLLSAAACAIDGEHWEGVEGETMESCCRALLDCAAACCGYQGWPSLLRIIAPATAAAWAANRGVAADIGVLPRLLCLPSPVAAADPLAALSTDTTESIRSGWGFPQSERAAVSSCFHAKEWRTQRAGGMYSLDPRCHGDVLLLNAAMQDVPVQELDPNPHSTSQDEISGAAMREAREALTPFVCVLAPAYAALAVAAPDAVSVRTPGEQDGPSDSDTVLAFAAEQQEALQKLLGLTEAAYATFCAPALVAAALSACGGESGALLGSEAQQLLSPVVDAERLLSRQPTAIATHLLLFNPRLPSTDRLDAPSPLLTRAGAVDGALAAARVCSSEGGGGASVLCSLHHGIAAWPAMQRLLKCTRSIPGHSPLRVLDLCSALDAAASHCAHPSHLLGVMAGMQAALCAALAADAESPGQSQRSKRGPRLCSAVLVTLLRALCGCVHKCVHAACITGSHVDALRMAGSLVQSLFALAQPAQAVLVLPFLRPLAGCLAHSSARWEEWLEGCAGGHPAIGAPCLAESVAFAGTLHACVHPLSHSKDPLSHGADPLSSPSFDADTADTATALFAGLGGAARDSPVAKAVRLLDVVCGSVLATFGDALKGSAEASPLWALPGLAHVPTARGELTHYCARRAELDDAAAATDSLPDDTTASTVALCTLAAAAHGLTVAATAASCERVGRLFSGCGGGGQPAAPLPPRDAVAVTARLLAACEAVGSDPLAHLAARHMRLVPIDMPAHEMVQSGRAPRLVVPAEVLDAVAPAVERLEQASHYPELQAQVMLIWHWVNLLHGIAAAHLAALALRAAPAELAAAAMACLRVALASPKASYGNATLLLTQAAKHDACAQLQPELALLRDLQAHSPVPGAAELNETLVAAALELDWRARLSELPDPLAGAGAWAIALVQALTAHPRCASCAACVAPVAACSAPLSATLVPLLLAAAATSPAGAAPAAASDAVDGDELRALLSAHLSRSVFPALSDAGGSALPASQEAVLMLVLQSLSALRSCYQTAKVCAGSRATRASASQGHPEHAAQARHVEAWPTEFWLDLDYLQVATGASRCGHHHEALLYLELWAARAGDCATAAPSSGAGATLPLGSGYGGPGAGAAPDARQLAPHEAVQWAAYTALQDADLSYGLAKLPKAPLLRMLAEQDGRWPEAMLLYSHHALRAAGAPSAAGLEQRTVSEADTAIARALVMMGCDEVASRVAAAPGQLLLLGHPPPGEGQAAPGHARRSVRRGQALLGNGAAAAARSVGQWTALPTNTREVLPGTLPELAHVLQGNVADAVAALEAAGAVAACTAGARCFEYPCAARHVVAELEVSATLRASLEALGAAGALRAPRSAHSSSALRGFEDVGKDWAVLRETLGRAQLPELLSIASRSHAALLQGVRAPPSYVTAALVQHAAVLRQCGALSLAQRAVMDAHLAHEAVQLDRRGEGVGARANGGPSERLARPWWRVEEARLLWSQGREELAVNLLASLLAGQRPPESSAGEQLRFAEAGCLGAEWEAALHRHPESHLMELFESAARDADRGSAAVHEPELVHVPSHVRFRLAAYADAQREATLQRLASRDVADRRALLAACRSRRDALAAEVRERAAREGWKTRRDGTVAAAEAQPLLQAIRRLRNDAAAIEAELAELDGRAARYLEVAVDGYSAAMACGDAHDLHASLRLVQLWLSNPDDVALDGRVRPAFQSLPSHKLLGLSYQAASRCGALGGRDAAFQETLRTLLTRLASDHPHHVLVTLLSLESQRGAASSGAVDKAAAATSVLHDVAACSRSMKALVAALRDVVAAYTAIATAQPSDVGRERRVMALKSLAPNAASVLAGRPDVPVVTFPITPRPDCDYRDLPYVARVRPEVSFPGGVNWPKVVVVEDNFKQVRRQLVKGNDDLRQDAVMQQFFALTNALLSADAAAARRGLRVQTYKAVALSPTAGVLEWVDGTMSLFSYLVSGSGAIKGAHARYRLPGGAAFSEVQQEVLEVQQRTRERGEWACVYQRVTERFPPVFRRFFLERYHSPAAWHEKHIAYARSLAVASMAGYVIGLGDRHTSNILIRSATAELVHIDLGIAFEGGRHLPTPEVVPFRLTRDFVDGLGVAGLDGPVRKCAEVALGVMRAARRAVLTVVEVFVHDPLYQWGVTSHKVAKHRSAEADSAIGEVASGALVANADAGRAVSRVSEKLKGLDWNQGEPLSTPGHVALLFQHAADPANLSQHYVGWAAWL